MVAVCQPPGFFLLDMPLRGEREANVPLFQRERSSRRTLAASTRRPAFTSSSESCRALCNAARSSSSSQSPGSRGRSSISVPSGRSVGSSTTSRPAFTRAFSVIVITFEILENLVFGDTSLLQLAGDVTAQHVVQFAFQLDRQGHFWSRKEDACEASVPRHKNRGFRSQQAGRLVSEFSHSTDPHDVVTLVTII